MSQPYYVLEIRYPDGLTETHEISDERRILGRSKVKADLQVNDKKASGRHCEVSFVGGNITVKDVGSTNGTVHNGQKSMQFALGPGGSFQLGDTHLRILAIHGFEDQEEAVKTMVSAPAWADEDEATRALSADQIAQVVASVDGSGQSKAVPAYEPVAPAHDEPMVEPMVDDAYPAEPVYDDPYPAEPAYDPEPVAAYPQDSGYPAGNSGYPAADDAEYDDPYAQHNDPYAETGQAPGYDDYAAQPAAQDDWPQQESTMREPGVPHGGGSGRGPRHAPSRGGGGAAGHMEAPVEMGFTGTGKENFILSFVHNGLLVLLSLGFYAPWAIIKLVKWKMANTELIASNGNRINLSFNGRGLPLLGKFFLGYFLCIITVFIYTPWFIVGLVRWFADNTDAQLDDGSEYGLSFELKGGELFKFMFVQGLFVTLSVMIYLPWYICKMRALYYSNTFILRDGQKVGTFEFTGKGGAFLILYLWNSFLLSPTLFIWYPWMAVNFMKFYKSNTHVHVNQRSFSGEFSGKGAQLLKINLKGFFLSLITLNIYSFWWRVDQQKYEDANTVWNEG